MALDKYKEKRNANVTPEPFGGKSKDKNVLIFTVQKHAATRLHYDFRLEMEGVLKSWAIPKGPTMDPTVKRLAMMVEDHPYDYHDFEGIIPKGEYGAGTVIVWDEGTYEPSNFKGKTKKERERHLMQSLESGQLKITLNGKKLKGEFAMVKTSGRGENSWLMIKHRDVFAYTEDITLMDKSVQSGQTLEEVKATSTNIYGQTNEKQAGKTKEKADEPRMNRSSTNSMKDNIMRVPDDLRNKNLSKEKIDKTIQTKVKEVEEQIPSPEDIKQLLKKGKKSKIPSTIKPMLATLVDEPFDHPEWVYEVKWDGYRTIAILYKGEVQLLSRNNKSFTEKYYPITKSLMEWKADVVIDGEIIVINEKGISEFGTLQNWRSESDGELVLYVFDVLWYDGKELIDLPLIERQAILKEILPADKDRIRISQVFPAQGIEFFNAARKLGLEGIIAKKADSTYTQDFRSKNWLKIKAVKNQEVVIGGYTLNEGTGKLFSSLLLGVYEKGKLQYVGKVGTGFNDKLQREMLQLFNPLIIEKSPFETEPDVNKPSRFRTNPPNTKAFWLKPEIVCEVSYGEITKDGVFRHPAFKGLRMDKKAKYVVREKESDTSAMVREEKIPKKQGKQKLVTAPKVIEKGTLLNPTDETQVKKINDHEIKFTNLSKVYWPEDGITKREMFNYYFRISEYILPYLKDRPQSLNRFPSGIHGQSFYQKNVKGKAPGWMKTFPYTSEGEQKEFLVGNNEATLMWMASLGCIEMNPWFSRIQAEDFPDFCIIDLDPDKNTFDQVIEAALVVKKLLDKVGVPSFPKTSGSTGMHIYIPMGAKYTYDQSQMFARLIVNIVHEEIPEFTTLERMISERKGKMYLDFLQNRPGATIASPYSLRPKPGATVSMPLHWDEVKKGLQMKDFTIHNAVQKAKRDGDLFKGVLGEGIDLMKVLDKLQ